MIETKERRMIYFDTKTTVFLDLIVFFKSKHVVMIMSVFFKLYFTFNSVSECTEMVL